MPQDTDNVRRILEQTLADRKLSRGEKRIVNTILDELAPTEHELGVIRSIAFDIAQTALTNSADKEIVDWLDDVTRLLANQTDSDTAPKRAEAHFTPGSDCPETIRGLIRATKRRLDICVFTITDNRISDTIIDAHRRGVQVRIITDDDKSLDRGSDIDELKRANVPVRFDDSPFHMHHKFAIFDRESLLTGSYNWTRGAAEKNEENFIITSDRRLLAPFTELFEELWKKFGH